MEQKHKIEEEFREKDSLFHGGKTHPAPKDSRLLGGFTKFQMPFQSRTKLKSLFCSPGLSRLKAVDEEKAPILDQCAPVHYLISAHWLDFNCVLCMCALLWWHGGIARAAVASLCGISFHCLLVDSGGSTNSYTQPVCISSAWNDASTFGQHHHHGHKCLNEWLLANIFHFLARLFLGKKCLRATALPGRSTRLKVKKLARLLSSANFQSC